MSNRYIGMDFQSRVAEFVSILAYNLGGYKAEARQIDSVLNSLNLAYRTANGKELTASDLKEVYKRYTHASPDTRTFLQNFTVYLAKYFLKEKK